MRLSKTEGGSNETTNPVAVNWISSGCVDALASERPDRGKTSERGEDICRADGGRLRYIYQGCTTGEEGTTRGGREARGRRVRTDRAFRDAKSQHGEES